MMKRLLIIIFAVLVLFKEVFSGHFSRSHWLGTPVQLECGTKWTVDCNWKYDDKTISIGNRYRYLFSTGVYTTDCSIVINLYHEEDVGNWSCWSLSTDESDGELLNSYTLSLSLKQHSGYMRSSPTNVTSQIGLPLTSIPCKFNIYLEECNWLRNGRPVHIANRYNYINNQGAGSDCSINITTVQEIDIGSWQCATSANNGHGYVVSKLGWLSKALNGTSPEAIEPTSRPKNFIEEQPTNFTVRIGETAKLGCKFKNPVKCVWLRKDQAIHVGYRYNYVNKPRIRNETTMADCSLTVSNVQMIDQGRWRCVGAGTDADEAILSNVAHILPSRDTVPAYILHHPKDLVISYGDNITMPCVFNSTVNCDWARDGKTVKISERYRYLSKEMGRNTVNCSIQIAFANEVDIGNWSCASMLNYTNSYSENTEVSLTFRKSPSKPVVLYNNKALKDGESIEFRNKEDTLVCSSERGNPSFGMSWRIGNHTIPGKYESKQVDRHLYTATIQLVTDDIKALFSINDEVPLLCEVAFPNMTDYSTKAIIRPFGKPKSIPIKLVKIPKTDAVPIVVLPTLPVIKLNKAVVKEIELSGRDEPLELTCISERGSDLPLLHWEVDGKEYHTPVTQFMEGMHWKNTLHTSITTWIADPLTFENATSLKCVMQHPDFEMPQYAEVRFIKHRAPIDPIIAINETLVKSTIEVPMDNATDIHCVSQNGYPAANLTWVLDGQTIAGFVETLKSGYNSYTSILHWADPAWDNFTKPADLKCVADHPEYDKPHFAQAIVKFVAASQDVSKISSQIEASAQLTSDFVIHLQTAGQAVKEGSQFIFQCESSKPINCTMKFNGITVEEIPAMPTVSSHHLINNHIIEFCIFKLPSFSKKHVGKWRCSSAEEPKVDSNEIFLSLTSPPLGPDIILGTTNVSELMLNSPSEVPDLQCIVRLSNPATSLMWVLDEREIKGDEEKLEVGTNLYSTILRWNLTFNLTQDRNAATLQCVASHPGFDTKYRLAQVIVTTTKIPDEPVILFYQREVPVVTQPLNISASDVGGFKCVCENGNPVPRLSWQMNSLPVSGIYEGHYIKPGLYTAELQWDSNNNNFLRKGPMQLMCIASHPGLHNNRQIRVRAILQNYGRPSPVVQQTTLPHSNLFYVGISISVLLLLSILLVGIVYSRLRNKSLSVQSAGTHIQRMFSFCLGRNKYKKDEPLIQYSQLDMEQNGIEAAIICDENNE